MVNENTNAIAPAMAKAPGLKASSHASESLPSNTHANARAPHDKANPQNRFVVFDNRTTEVPGRVLFRREIITGSSTPPSGDHEPGSSLAMVRS